MMAALRFALVGVIAGIFAGIVGAQSGGDERQLRGSGATATGVFRDGFETPEPVWQSEHTDTVIRLLEHDRSQRAAHSGRLSEHFHFEAGPGQPVFRELCHAEDPGFG